MPNPDVMENYMSTVAINATLAAAVAATRTAIDVQEKVEATLERTYPYHSTSYPYDRVSVDCIAVCRPSSGAKLGS